jgi:phenylalanyl-tRNA synthetase beta chain
MKVTLNWLKQYVDFDWSPEELTERLTLLGLEVEGVTHLKGDFEGVVVAQVITRDKHPNADKLSVCRVADGKGERQIVCGAQNFQAGDKVPLILPGASLPPKPGDKESFTIKVGKIRGVESHGMMCSPTELGLPDVVDGLLILPADAKVGQPLAEHLGRSGSDVVYDLEITPNRPDLNSLIGIAREIAALTGNPLRIPANTHEFPSSGTAPVAVRVEAADLCPRYTAQVLRGVKVGPSPDWLRSALEKVGLRSINNVVDVSNYVMLETGQPLHTFDLHLIAKSAADAGVPTLVIRRATEGEAFTTLDGKAHQLKSETLLIADTEKGIALAGVMGGQNTEIRDTTTDVLIESAYFTPTHVRRTSKSLGLRTDASYRYERGADPEASAAAGRRCAELILATAGGRVDGPLVDVRPAALEVKTVTLRHDRSTALLGIEIPVADQTGMLVRLGLSVDAEGSNETSTRFRIPSWRVDLKREADLVEEVARLYGVDRIPSTTPRRASGSHPFDAMYDQLAEIRRVVASLGLNEAQGQTLISDESARWITPEPVLLANPLSSDMNALRPSLLPGLIDSLSNNLTRRNGDVQLFEVGRVFTKSGDTVREGWRLAFAMTGARNPQFWSGADRDATCDLSDLKGVVEEVIEFLGLRGVVVTRRTEVTPLWVESATLSLGGKLPLGQMGQMQPVLAKRRELRDTVLLAELDLDVLLARRNSAKSFKPLPQFPSVRRDVAMIVPESVTHDAVLGVVRQLKPANLESIEPFDLFRGRHVPAGQKSLAYALTYRAADRTLREEDVSPVHSKLVAGFQQTLGAVMRE